MRSLVPGSPRIAGVPDRDTAHRLASASTQARRNRPMQRQIRAAFRPLVILIGGMLLVMSGAPVAAAAPDPPVRLRIGVTSDGIVRITPSDFVAAGLDPAAADPNTFAMSSLGKPIAIRVIADEDGQFEEGESLWFFGQRFRSQEAMHPEMEEKYTDERAYWLEVGGSPGPRIGEVDARPNPEENLTSPQHFLTTMRAEESRLWWTLTSGGANPALDQMDKWDTWFWDMLQTRNPVSETLDFPYVVPYPASGVTATLRLEQIPREFSVKCDPDHRTVARLNGYTLLDETWDGKVRKVFTAVVPANLLTHGTNTLKVTALNPPDLESCIYAPNPLRPVSYRVYVNYWELDYRRLFRAWNGYLDFRTENDGPHEYVVSGWPSDQVEIWDITDPDSPRRLTGAVAEPEVVFQIWMPLILSGSRQEGIAAPSQSESRTKLRFRVADTPGMRFWLQAAATIGSPSTVRVRTSTAWLRDSGNGADVVLLTPADLASAAGRLATWHAEHGRRALVIDIQDVYDEFNNGIFHPKAVPALLAYAREHWAPPAPAYLTLVGDGHWNFKNYNVALYPPGPNLIPPYLAWVDPWQGEVPADPLYGDTDEDGMPEVAVGRLAVTNLEQANTVVDKIIAYDEDRRVQPWQKSALFVADWDASLQTPTYFQILTNQIIANYLPPDITPVRAYLGGTSETDILTARTAISQALQSGVWMAQYFGHGDIDRWSGGSIWRASDALGLHNAPALPVVMTFNCKDGYFAFPGKVSIAEAMQRQPGGGSVAAISPSGLGDASTQHNVRTYLMSALFQDQVREIGQALLIAKQRFRDDGGDYYPIATLMLYGDPAMRLPQAPTEGLSATAGAGTPRSDPPGIAQKCREMVRAVAEPE